MLELSKGSPVELGLRPDLPMTDKFGHQGDAPGGMVEAVEDVHVMTTTIVIDTKVYAMSNLPDPMNMSEAENRGHDGRVDDCRLQEEKKIDIPRAKAQVP